MVEVLKIVSLQFLDLSPKRVTIMIIFKVVKGFGLNGLLENITE